MNLYNKLCVVVMSEGYYVARIITDNGYIIQLQPIGHNSTLTFGKPLADRRFERARIPIFNI